jgi:5'-nucleotidase
MKGVAAMRALVTNDDGIHSPGLHALAEVAVHAGLEVTIAAPHEERSGASASLTALEEGGRLVIHESEPRIDGVERVLGVEASPAFIVMAALAGAFGPAPGLILSGINLGPNTGHAVLHSGTVGAALTGATLSCPGLAFSLAASRPTQFGTAAGVASQVVAWVLEREVPPDLVLNVNIPDVPLHELRGLRQAALAEFGAVQAEVGETAKGFSTITFSQIDAQYESDTDAGLVREGWATITALSSPCEASGVDVSGLPIGDREFQPTEAARAAPTPDPT